MDLKVEGTRLIVELSERNLRTLLSKLDREESLRTLRMVDHDSRMIVSVVAVPDSEHYSDREPGPVHPLDEPS